MMKKNSIKERAKKVPIEIKLMVNRSMATAKQISRILVKQGKSQKDLANLLGKKESEISKWLTGTHNFTYKTIGKIEAVLGEQIILTADQALLNVNIITAVVADSKEQAICIQPLHDTHFIIVGKDNNYTLTQSVSPMAKSNSVFNLEQACVLN